jgi:hypothetical protein
VCVDFFKCDRLAEGGIPLSLNISVRISPTFVPFSNSFANYSAIRHLPFGCRIGSGLITLMPLDNQR